MSRKHVIEYYKSVESQYFDLLNDAEDMQQAVKDKILSESQLEEFTKLIDKVKTNYTRLSYIMYLLDLPNKKSKENRNSKQYKKTKQIFNGLNATSEDIIEENKGTLNQFKELVNKTIEQLAMEKEKDDKKTSN